MTGQEIGIGLALLGLFVWCLCERWHYLKEQSR